MTLTLRSTTTFSLFAALAIAGLASAQSQPVSAAPAAKPAVPAKATAPAEEVPVMPVVTVEAERPTSRIDRQVYDVKADVGSTNGSAADALNNVPSVQVDPDGTVSLRGSTNVQIMIDGKPSAMLQGDNRGAALNSLPSDDIESVEVINNPGAQFGNEAGGGPIINLVMRRNRKPGGLGFVNANAGVKGRYNASASGSYNEGRMSYQGNVNVRHDGRDSVGESTRERLDGLGGPPSRSSQQGYSHGLNDSAAVNGQVGYNLGDKDKLTFAVNYSQRSNNNQGAEHYINYGTASSALSDYTRSTDRSGENRNYGWVAHADHKGDVDGESFKLDLRVSSARTTSDNIFHTAYLINPGRGVDSQGTQDSSNGNKITDLTGDYERPIGAGMLKLGFKTASNALDFDTRYTDLDPRTQQQIVNPMRTNRFDLDETNLALYGIYEYRFNENWGVVGGLRVEHSKFDIHQRTTAIDAVNTDLSYIPSFYVSYKTADKSTIRLRYSHRIRRPNSNDLNPFVIYRDEFNVSSGNPKLAPTQNDAIEIEYASNFGIVDANLRAYFRKDRDLIAERSYFISDTVLLTTRDNAASARSGGLEFSANAKLTKALSINTSGNAAYFEQNGRDRFGVLQNRSSPSLSAKARINYQLSDADQFQLTLNAQGKTLNGVGYTEPNRTANMSLRHALTPRLNLVLNVTDVFDSNKSVRITDTDVIHDRAMRHFDGRVVYIGFSYRLGGVTPAARGEGRERGGGMQRRGGGGNNGGGGNGGGNNGGGGGGGNNGGGGDAGM